MKSPIRLIIADDHALIRDGLKKILSMEDNSEISLVAEAHNGKEAISLSKELKPDIILMDINMPEVNGIEATKVIKETEPEIAVVILTIHDGREYIYELMDCGVEGYILKDTSAKDLVSVIKKVAAGDTYVDPRMTGKMVGEWRRQSEARNTKEKLTERELEILTEIARGENNRTIAEKLFVSEKTVKNHITSILSKLHLNDRTQAAIYAIKNNLVDV